MKAQLTQREKVLSIAVGGIAFVFINYFVFDLFMKNRAALTLGIARQTAQLKLTRTRFAEKPIWQEREAWLAAQQPKLVNESSAAVDLFDQVKKTAALHSVTVENPQLKPPVSRPDCMAVTVDLEVRSSWKSLIVFLIDLQKPGQFIALERMNLKIDAKDQTQMSGRFTVAKWYAPR
jgi:hypothetical protein